MVSNEERGRLIVVHINEALTKISTVISHYYRMCVNLDKGIVGSRALMMCSRLVPLSALGYEQ
jgi:hypothetical protein